MRLPIQSRAGQPARHAIWRIEEEQLLVEFTVFASNRFSVARLGKHILSPFCVQIIEELK